MSAKGARSGLADRLRLIVITDAGVAAPRSILDIVQAALAAGAPAVQLRHKGASAGELYDLGRALRKVTDRHEALFFVNDRFDVALAVGADGAHLGPDDVPVSAARRAVAPDFLLGFSADDPAAARQAVRDGADYIGCGTVYGTSHKPDAGEIIGPEGLELVASAVDVPVVGIGGVTAERGPEVAATGAAGAAVIGAVMGAEDPASATRLLLGALGG